MKKLNAILSELLEMDESEICDSLSPDHVAMWDSLTGLMLMTALEQEYGVELSTKDLKNVKCVGDIKKMLMAYGCC